MSSEEMNPKGISRRSFIKGTVAGTAGIATISILGGCAPNQVSVDGVALDYEKPNRQVSETLSTDIVVVGAGNSGLAAGVQAAQLGAKVILLESQPNIGGGGQGTEGILGIGSQMQKDAGIEVDTTELIDKENNIFNYRLNPWFWKDMFLASGDDIDWLVENGVLFKGIVDDYNGWGHGLMVFHWWKDGKGINYSEPMAAKAEELGVTIMVETPANDLILDDGKITGIYATKANGDVIQINCTAVILAAGGYAQNTEMMNARGLNLTDNPFVGYPGQNGDGLRMAIDAGGVDVSVHRGFLRTTGYAGLNFFSNLAFSLNDISPVWVNQDAERYVKENLQPTYMDSYAVNAILSQDRSFVIVDQALLEKTASSVEGFMEEVETAVAENKGNGIFKADTLEELAAKVELDPEALSTTISQYNELCAQGVDKDWNKPGEYMTPLETAPYYIFKHQVVYITSIGGVKINRNMEVLTQSGQAISGLYAAGTTACELYRETYTIDKPGSMNGHNIYSGRTAAKNAVALLK